MDKRVSMLNQAWGQPEYNHFGTDEFLNFCRLAGTQPQICVNLGSGTVEEAVEWVKYVNARWGKGVTWELGNERGQRPDWVSDAGPDCGANTRILPRRCARWIPARN